MTGTPLAAKTFRDYRGPAVGAGFAGSLIGLLHVLVYPQYRDAIENIQLGAFKGLYGQAGSIGSPAGFIGYHMNLVAFLVIIIAIIGGSGVLAGEEAAGTLDLELAQPVRRSRLLLEKSAGMVAVVVFAVLLCAPGFLLGKALAGFDLSYALLFEGVASQAPVTLLFLGFTICAAATLPTRAAAATASTGAVIIAFFLNTIGALASVLSGPRRLSPFYWSDTSHVLIDGFDWPRATALAGIGLAFIALALVSFQRRDIAAGWGGPWSLGHRPAVLGSRREASGPMA